MKTMKKLRLSAVVLLGSIFASQAALAGAVIGDVKDTKKGMKQAIKCNYDKALEKLDTAIAEGGFAAELAALEKVVVLLDAGREAEAEKALAKRNESIGASDEDIAEARKSIDETLEGLRTEREKQTGSRTCP